MDYVNMILSLFGIGEHMGHYSSPLSLNQMASATKVNSDVAIQASFGDSVNKPSEKICLTWHQTEFSNPMLDKPVGKACLT
jgi:hypothetical protein